VVCNGDFNKETMSAAQKAALLKVIKDIFIFFHFSSVRQIYGHKEVDNTDCPGRKFPLEDVKTYIMNGGK